jgi:hypothetical protein
MALPSVPELVAWVGAHSSVPFDVAATRVPASALRHAAARFPELAAALGVQRAAAGAPPGDGAAPPAAAAAATITLAELCEDMEVEARAIESAVFQTFWLASVVEKYAEAFGLDPSGGGAGASGGGGDGEGAGAGNAAAGGQQPQQQQQVQVSDSSPPTPPPSRGAKLAGLQRLLAAAKEAAVERASYGGAEAAEAAMDACDEFLQGTGLLDELRSHMRDEAEADAELRAARAARELVGGAGTA